MRVVAVYRAESDYARRVIDFLHDFNRQTGHTIDAKYVARAAAADD